MNRPLVIARSWAGEPLRRVAIGVRNGLVYIVNPEHIEAVESGDSSAVGFPAEDVFVFQEETYTVLAECWRHDQTTERESWAALERYAPNSGASNLAST